MADAPFWTSLWCMLCSGGIGEQAWTKEFTVGMENLLSIESQLKSSLVFIKDDHAHIGTLTYSRSLNRFEVFSNLPASDTSIVLKITRVFNLTPTDVFLIHSSCYRFLQDSSCANINPIQVFKLCQALQPDKETYGPFGWLDLAGARYTFIQIQTESS